jgi:hypothetical protein
MLTNENQAVIEIFRDLEFIKTRLDEGLINGNRALREFISTLPRAAFTYEDFKITQAYTSLALAPTLLNTYFEKKIQKEILKELESEKTKNENIKIMLMREIHGLDADKAL